MSGCGGGADQYYCSHVTNPVLVLAAVLGMLFTATNTKLRLGTLHAIPAIAPSHSDHTRQEAALITTICSAHSRPAEISIPHFVMMTQTYLKCLLLLHINTPNMTREENFEYRKYAARSSSAVIHSSHLQHCNERFIACIMCDGVRTVVTMLTTGSGSHLFSFTTITQQQLHLSRHVS